MDFIKTNKNQQHKKCFYKELKLTKTDEFSSVFNFRRRLYSVHLVLNLKPNDLGFARVGFVIGKKTAKSAVARNYMRRVLREFFRLHHAKIGAFDLVINARVKFTKANFVILQQEFFQILAKISSQFSKSNAI